MAVILIESENEREIPFVRGDTVLDILSKGEINAETVIVKRNGKIIADDEEVSDGDTLTVLKIVSGG